LVATELIKIDDVIKSNIAYAYDALGNLTKMTDRLVTPNVVAIFKRFDQDGRILEAVDDEGVTYKFTYDVRGNPKQIQQRTYTVNYTFDTAGSFKQAKASDGGLLTWEACAAIR
jgi:YD repeat-containing protein